VERLRTTVFIDNHDPRFFQPAWEKNQDASQGGQEDVADVTTGIEEVTDGDLGCTRHRPY